MFSLGIALGLAIAPETRQKANAVGVAGPMLVEDDLLATLIARYGEERYSQGPEEWLIRDFFDGETNGVFVDVGAWEPVQWSNTYRLERHFGWSGLAIDAIAEFEAEYARERPRSRFVNAFVTDVEGGTETLHVAPRATAVSSRDDTFVRRFADETVARSVPRRTLNSLLNEAGIEAIDFLNMDIELGEVKALQGFDIDRYRPRLICIEAHGETRQGILDYFARHGYVLVGRYLPYDPVNLYFMPAREK